MEYYQLDDTVYFHFASNDTSGSGDDGATPLCDIRLCGAASSAAPVYSPTPVLLSDAGYPAGCYEVAIAATAGNGFAAGNTYAVFCSLTVDSQNPTGFVGKFILDRQDVNIKEISDDSNAADNCEAVFDNTGYSMSNSTLGTVTTLTGHTPQTGDSYAVVTNGTYGLSAIEDLVDEVESEIKNGTYGLSALKTLVDAIKAITDNNHGGIIDANIKEIDDIAVKDDGAGYLLVKNDESERILSEDTYFDSYEMHTSGQTGLRIDQYTRGSGTKEKTIDNTYDANGVIQDEVVS